MLKQPKNQISYLIIGSVVCAALLLACICMFFVHKLESKHIAQTKFFLDIMAENVGHSAKIYIYNSQKQAEIIASFLSNHDVTDVEKSLDRIQERGLVQGYKVYGVLWLDGSMHTVLDGGKQAYFDTASKAELLDVTKQIHGIVYEGESQRSYSLVSAPIMRNGQLLGVFFVGNPYNLLAGVIVPNTLDEGDSSYFIADKYGMIMSSTGKIVGTGDELLEIAKESSLQNANDMQALQHSFTKEEKGHFSLSIKGQPYSVSLTPLHIEGWMLGAVMPAEFTHNKVHKIVVILAGIVGVWFLLFMLLALYIYVLQKNSQKKYVEQAKHLEWLLNELPSGVLRCAADDAWTILSCSDTLLQIIGMTREELERDYENSWYNVVHPKDRPLLQQKLYNTPVGMVDCEYRVLGKNGESIWVLDSTKHMHDESGKWYWCVIVNVDNSKKNYARERSLIERYRQLFAMSESSLYEFYPDTKQFLLAPFFFQKFGYPLPECAEELKNSDNDYYPMSTDIIHPDDMDLFTSMQIKTKLGKGAAVGLLRLKTNNGQWLWCQLRQNSWENPETGHMIAIGKIDNVDEETRTLNKLRDDVQRDPFTGLFNKTATAELVQRELTMVGDFRGALCIIDADNFKQVNDTFGHAMGDVVIKNLATGLARIFRSDDIVGRVGGDEFIVYIKNMPKLRPLLLKMDTVQDFFKQTFEDGNMKVSISSSIGIALYPKDGRSYEELYRHADKALYRSKMKKGTYNFYDKDID